MNENIWKFENFGVPVTDMIRIMGFVLEVTLTFVDTREGKCRCFDRNSQNLKRSSTQY